MFSRLFGRTSKANHDLVDILYGQIVAAARQEDFYAHWAIPDTPLGRFEMIGLHMFLFLRRTRSGSDELAELGQEVTDLFFKEVDHSLRELGIGDNSVPKRMKKLARMYFGRLESYEDAIAKDDRLALSAALARNIRPDNETWKDAARLADYVVEADRGLSRQEDAAIMRGVIAFPDARIFGDSHE